MSAEPDVALDNLIRAFREHYASARKGVDCESLEATENTLRDAFFTYDDVLFTRFGVELPFDLLEDIFEDEDDDEDVELDDEGDDDFIDIDD